MINRITRSRVSRYLWAVLTIGCVVGVLLVGRQQTQTLATEVAAAQAQSRDIANTTLIENLSYDTIVGPIPAPLYRDVTISLQSSVFKDANIARVRIWRPDGTLQFSTHERDQVGLLKTDDKTLIDQAMQGKTASVRVVTDFSAASTGSDQTQTNLLEVFVPLHVFDRVSIVGVAEVDYYYDKLVKAVHDQWFKLIVTLLVLASVCLIMTLLSLRKPIATGDTGRAPSAGADKAVKALQRDAERTPARTMKAEADSANMREQLSGTRDQVKQAEEAYLLLKAQLKERQADVAPAAEGTSLDAAGLGLAAEEAKSAGEAALALKETELAGVQEELERVRADLQLKTEEAATSAAAAAAAEARASTAEAAVAQAVTSAAQPGGQISPPAPIGDDVLAKLEERVVSAEQRAGDAEGKLKGVLEILAIGEEPTDAEAAAAVGDLRNRLARTASRKKLGGEDGSLASTSRAEAEGVRTTQGAELQRSLAGEIRGPLSTLKGLSLSLKGAVGTPEGKDMVRQMNITVKKLDRLASDLAEVGEISDGSLALNRRRTDLEAFVSRVVSEVDGAGNLDIRMDLEPAQISVDPSRLQQIVDGMLNHARGRTSSAGTICIRLTEDDDGVTIAVEDEGEPNATVGSELLLASRLAELHGGRLWSEARVAGDGVCVKVFLPGEPASP